MQVINLLSLISQLEDEKWQCVLKGAEFKPELEMRMEVIDRKLDKLYAWLSKAYANGLVKQLPTGQFGPLAPPVVDRRKTKKA